MEIEAAGGVAQATSTATNNTISQEEFIKLFLAQLNFQDPLEPVDNREFLTQMAQFSQLQVAGEQNQSLSQLLLFNSSDQGLSLLGKTVDVDLNNTQFSGTVQAVHFTNSGANVTILRTDGTTSPNIPISGISLAK